MLRLLERTRRTRFELARKLKDRGFDAAVIDPVLDRLAGVGPVDDVEYARAWLAGRWGGAPPAGGVWKESFARADLGRRHRVRASAAGRAPGRGRRGLAPRGA